MFIILLIKDIFKLFLKASTSLGSKVFSLAYNSICSCTFFRLAFSFLSASTPRVSWKIFLCFNLKLSSPDNEYFLEVIIEEDIYIE